MPKISRNGLQNAPKKKPFLFLLIILTFFFKYSCENVSRGGHKTTALDNFNPVGR